MKTTDCRVSFLLVFKKTSVSFVGVKNVFFFIVGYHGYQLQPLLMTPVCSLNGDTASRARLDQPDPIYKGPATSHSPMDPSPKLGSRTWSRWLSGQEAQILATYHQVFLNCSLSGPSPITDPTRDKHHLTT